MPFVNEEEDGSDIDYFPQYEHVTEKRGNSIRSFLERDDRKFFLIGGAAALVTFCVISYIMYSSSRPIDLDDLPVIRADPTPIKVKPPKNGQISHQDKIVYDNISGDSRNVVEKTAPPPEEVLSISEIDSNDALSAKEKKEIIEAFDKLAPEKEYKINYVKTSGSESSKSKTLKAVEENPPIKKVEPDESRIEESHKKKKIADLINNPKDIAAISKNGDVDIENAYDVSSLKRGGNIMLQIGSLPTKSAAEAEYKRVIRRNKFLKQFSKKIEKIDLGRKKGITYRIKVGPFKSKSDANKAISSLKRRGFSSYISR